MEDLIRTEQKGDTKQKLVYQYDLSKCEQPFDLINVKARQYRFVECSSVLENNTIKVYAYKELSSVPPYTVVSYIWDGKKVEPEDPASTFGVVAFNKDKNKYKTAGRPISMQIIKDACTAARKQGTDLLWLDRLCMNKSDKDDDAWQTGQMYNIYKGSKFCIVFPAGLETLTPLNEKTKWIDRGWTLQEAVAPPKVEVMFEWTLGSSKAHPSLFDTTHEGQITEITPGRCAMAPLLLLLDSTISGSLKLINDDPPNSDKNHTVNIFGTIDRPKVDIKTDFRLVLPNVAALAVILTSARNTDEYYHAIWKSTMMRSTSRAYDMIFSIMGLFDVNLDPAKYDNKHDCVKPAIDLVRKILGTKGARATWLGASFFSPPCPHISTFPSFPKLFTQPSKENPKPDPTVAIPGRGRVLPPQLMLNERPDFGDLDPMPTAAMGEKGYLSFTARSVPLSSKPSYNTTQTSQGSGYCFKAINGATWFSCRESHKTQAFAVLLGCFKAYSPFDKEKDEEESGYDASNIRGFIVVREHDDHSNFYLNSYFMLNVKALPWLKGWKKRKFKVGGRHQLGAPVLYEKNLPKFDLKDYIPETLRSLQPKSIPVKPMNSNQAECPEDASLEKEHRGDTQFEVEALEVEALDIRALDVEAIKVEAIEVKAVEADAVEADAVEADAVEADAVEAEAEAVEAEAVEVESFEYEAVEDEPSDESFEAEEYTRTANIRDGAGRIRRTQLHRPTNDATGSANSAGSLSPLAHYQLVNGDPWQEEGRWTSKAMKELRDGLMKSG